MDTVKDGDLILQLHGVRLLESQRAVHTDIALAVERVEEEVSAVGLDRGGLLGCVRWPNERERWKEDKQEMHLRGVVTLGLDRRQHVSE